MGTIHLLKKGGPTVMRSPMSLSEIVGNIVATRMKKAAKRRIQLLTTNANSRETQLSSSLRERMSGKR